jgi:hypothetical protein
MSTPLDGLLVRCPKGYTIFGTPEFVADLILRRIEEGEAQYFANDRLRQLAGA